jgi:hypothetical protein
MLAYSILNGFKFTEKPTACKSENIARDWEALAKYNHVGAVFDSQGPTNNNYQ